MPIDITDQPRRVQYVGSGSGPYEFNFEVLQQTDIEVYKDTTLLTLTTDYTVALNADGTGSVTTVASMTGFTVTIAGSRPYARITDFSTGGDFFADTVNDELDSQQIQILQLRDSLDRGIRAPVTDNPSLDMTLPVAASRAGKFMAFDANGELTTSAGTGTDNSLRTDLAASGGSTLLGFIQSGTGAVAETVQNAIRNFGKSIKSFDADVNGTEDDSTAVQAAIDAAAASIAPASGQQTAVLGVAGVCQLGTQIIVKRGVRLIAPTTVFRPTSDAINLFLVEPGASIDILVDTTAVTYSGQAITLDATTSGATFDAVAGRHSEVKATMLGTNGEGTAVYLHQNDAQGIAFVDFDLTINGFSKGIDINSQGAGFINGNRFRGTIRAASTAIDIRGAGTAPDGNIFDMTIQAVGGSSVRGWFVEQGSFNLFTGYLWDTGSFSTSAVEFGAGAGTYNKALVPDAIVAGKVVNNSSSTTNGAGRPTLSQAVGTWTPVLSFGGASVGITYGTQSGRYLQAAQRTFFDLHITLTNKGSSAGAAVITLPVTINASALTPGFSIALASSLGAGVTTQLLAFGNTNSVNMSLYMFAAGGVTALVDTDFTNTTDLRISGNYEY